MLAIRTGTQVYYPEGMKAQVQPCAVRSSVRQILAPTRDSRPGTSDGPQSKLVTTILSAGNPYIAMNTPCIEWTLPFFYIEWTPHTLILNTPYIELNTPYIEWTPHTLNEHPIHWINTPYIEWTPHTLNDTPHDILAFFLDFKILLHSRKQSWITYYMMKPQQLQKASERAYPLTYWPTYILSYS